MWAEPVKQLCPHIDAANNSNIFLLFPSVLVGMPRGDAVVAEALTLKRIRCPAKIEIEDVQY